MLSDLWDDPDVAAVITASEPSWIVPFTGLSPRQFGKLVTALQRQGVDPVRKGRPWSLPLEDRVLLVAASWRTNLTSRQRNWWPALRRSFTGQPRVARTVPCWTSQARHSHQRQLRSSIIWRAASARSSQKSTVTGWTSPISMRTPSTISHSWRPMSSRTSPTVCPFSAAASSDSRSTARRRSVNASSISCIVPCPRTPVHRRQGRSQPHDTPGWSQQAGFLSHYFQQLDGDPPHRAASWASSDKPVSDARCCRSTPRCCPGSTSRRPTSWPVVNARSTKAGAGRSKASTSP
ncbi:hypothetical protein SAMN04487981_104542 [Streptomyces sp. cf386]|nr:hypothetical protein SAMN04487981_104542 [Streptomyces sp. cf386]